MSPQPKPDGADRDLHIEQTLLLELQTIDHAYFDHRLLTIIHAAMAGADEIMSRFGQGGAEAKIDGSLVTAADIAASDAIAGRLRASNAFRSTAILDEETSGDAPADEEFLAVDPLDGTTNFVVGVPFFAVSIALLREGRPVLAAVLDPVARDLYVGRLEAGAFQINMTPQAGSAARARARRLGGSRRGGDDVSRVRAYCHGPRLLEAEAALRILHAFQHHHHRVRQFGCASLELCRVATGRLGSFHMSGIRLWDVAAGALIASEAGFDIVDYAGAPFDAASRDVLACRRSETSGLLGLIKGAVSQVAN